MEYSKNDASSLGYSWMQSLFDRSTVCLVLLSMTIQLILVLGGALRHRTANRLLNFIVWICYMGADFVATSALGSMIHFSSRATVYAIWASVLMVHLAGPDTITAYSVPDNKLWRRHCLSLLSQGSLAAYVVYVYAVQGGAEIEWHMLGAASLIFVVGITKYGERAWALSLASPSEIARSVKPIYNFMKIEHALGLHIDEQISDDEIADVDQFRELERRLNLDAGDYQYIVAGEECFDEDGHSGDWSESIVTIKDVWEQEGEVTDNYILCVSHALFKMYKRRFGGLRFHEAKLQKTEKFFRGWRIKEIQIFQIIEIELKFMYDYLFSKSSGTAFSLCGFGMRVMNISLLGFCWFLMIPGLKKTQDVFHWQRTVTYILMFIALGLEVFQLGRIILSDWSMVWLICASIRQSRKLSKTWWCSFSTRFIQRVGKAVGRVRELVGCKYWQNRIQQLCVIETCFTGGSYRYPLVKRLVGVLHLKGFIRRAVTARHIKSEFLDDESKNRIRDYVGAWEPRFHLDYVKRMMEREGVGDEGEEGGWEHVILANHIRTTICEKLDQSTDDEDVKKDICLGVMLSRYFAYLLITCPHILPVEVEHAKMLYNEVFAEIEVFAENATFDEFCTNFKDSDEGGSLTLRIARKLLTRSLESPVEDRWDDLVGGWMFKLCLVSAYEKIAEHGERMTMGGEFLTQLWVLSGHTGWSEESYSSTAMKTAPQKFY